MFHSGFIGGAGPTGFGIVGGSGSEPPGGDPVPGFGDGVPGSGFDIGDPCASLPPFLQPSCRSALGGFDLFGGNGGGGGSGTPVFDCPEGFVQGPQGCEFKGSPGDISTPNGKGGAAVMTPFGLSTSPITVGNIRGNPIRRCPRGLVLGKDNRCYAQGKGGITNQQRKWPKPARSPVSALDARLMRKYGAQGTKRDSIKKLAVDAGFSCKNK